MKNRLAIGGLAIVLVVLNWQPVQAQGGQLWPLSPSERNIISEGLPVSPFFEGWYENPDGTYTLSFGYFNRNTEEVLGLPVGSDNFIEPAEYNGLQPTQFPPGRGTGVFTVTVPGEFARNGGRVIWTLRSYGHTHSVPGKVGVAMYRLHYGPMAMGSLPPMLKLDPDGPELWGPMSAAGDPRIESVRSGSKAPRGSVETPVPYTAAVGTPLTLTVWVADRLAPGAARDPLPVAGVTWFTHQGPGLAVFSEKQPKPDQADGKAITTVTFNEPGEYVLRVRADNFNPVDSTPSDECCWTNAYVKVTVTP